jgi:hypothetical protein
MKFLVGLDSRYSIGTGPSNCRFVLNQQIVDIVRCRLLTFSFANTLSNVVSPNNTLVFDSVTVTLPEGYYNYSAFITAINTQLLASAPFVAAMGGATDAVVLSADDHNVMQSGGMLYNFVLSGEQTGNFISDLFLAIPQSIALHSSNLQGPDRFVTCEPTQISSPFAVLAVQSGFGEMESVDQSNSLQMSTAISHGNLSSLDVIVRDASSYRELTDISHWWCLLELTTTS